MEIGNNLRQLRKQKGYTLVQVNRQTGLSISFLSDMERGRTNPSLDTLQKLGDCYHVTVNELLGEQLPAADPHPLHPPAFQEFLDEISVDSDLIAVLLIVEGRAVRRAKSKEDWKQFYYSLKAILGR